MKFSVIICTYNVSRKLPKTLDALLLQVFSDFEVVIVDGASADGTVEVVREYEKKFDGRLRWVSEKDSGIYNAMNKGVQMAQGEYINVIGAGDWHEAGALEGAAKCIKDNSYPDAVQGKLRVWDKEQRKNYLLQTFARDLYRKPMQHPALFYKKRLHNRFGLYSEEYRIASDYLFCIKSFFIGGATIIPLDLVVSNFVLDGISSTQTSLCQAENRRIWEETGLLPLVSIIIPSYNQGKYIPETLECLIKQSYPNWECIIFDDGSQDDTSSIVQGFCKKDSRFRYFKQKNSGPSVARNNAISKSNGTYILPLDSDDLISEEYVWDCIGVFLGRPEVKLVYCKARLFGEKDEEWNLPEYSFEEILFANMVFCSAMYRKSDYEKTNGYNVNMRSGLEDWDFWLSFLEEGDVVYRIPEVHFFYRIKRMSRNYKVYSDDYRLKDAYKNIYLNHQEKYRNHINPVYTEVRLKMLEERMNILQKEFLRSQVGNFPLLFYFKKLLFKTKTYICLGVGKFSFLFLSPIQCAKKYWKLFLNSKLRQHFRKLYYSLRGKKITR